MGGRREARWELAQSRRAPQRVGAAFGPSSAHSILLDHIIAKEPASNFPEPFEIVSELRVKALTLVPVEFEMRFLRAVIIKRCSTVCKEGFVMVIRPGGILEEKFLTFSHMVTKPHKKFSSVLFTSCL